MEDKRKDQWLRKGKEKERFEKTSIIIKDRRVIIIFKGIRFFKYVVNK